MRAHVERLRRRSFSSEGPYFSEVERSSLQTIERMVSALGEWRPGDTQWERRHAGTIGAARLLCDRSKGAR